MARRCPSFWADAPDRTVGAQLVVLGRKLFTLSACQKTDQCRLVEIEHLRARELSVAQLYRPGTSPSNRAMRRSAAVGCNGFHVSLPEGPDRSRPLGVAPYGQGWRPVKLDVRRVKLSLLLRCGDLARITLLDRSKQVEHELNAVLPVWPPAHTQAGFYVRSRSTEVVWHRTAALARFTAATRASTSEPSVS